MMTQNERAEYHDDRDDLQCVAVCCNVLQYIVAVSCRVLWCVAGCCRMLQGVAGCCRVLQCVLIIKGQSMMILCVMRVACTKALR